MKTYRFHPAILIILVACSIILSGCYTLLKHPRVAEGNDHEDYSNCAACHGQFVRPSPYDIYYYRGMWSDYYSFPWWYGTYWEKDYMDDYFTAPERGVIKRDIKRSTKPYDMEKGVGTSRVRLKPSGGLSEDKKLDQQESKNIKTKEKSIKKHEPTSSKRNIIRRRGVKEKRKENPKKK